MKQSDIVFLTLDTVDGTHSLKQHAFKSVKRKRPYTGEEYQSNVSLCSNRYATLDTIESENIDVLPTEPISDRCCKKCLKIYNNLPA